MKVRHFLSVLLLVSASAIPAVAMAQPSDVDKATARTLTIEGYDALDRKDYAGAIDRFTRADSLFHAPTVTLGLARAQAGLGKLVTAQETYNRILHEPVPTKPPPAFVKALEDARKDLTALESRIPYVAIEVKGAGNGAPSVVFDGAPVPAAALGVKRPVDPGKHTIRASAPGFATSEVTVTLVEGKSQVVTIELKPAASATPPVAPPVAPPVSPGPGPEPAPAAKPDPLPPAAPSRDTSNTSMPTLRKVGIGVGVAGLAGAGAGVALGALALGVRSDLQKACPNPEACPSGQQANIDKYHTLGNASLALIIVGGAATVTGVVLIAIAPKPKAVERAFIKPVIGPGYLGAQGRF